MKVLSVFICGFDDVDHLEDQEVVRDCFTDGHTVALRAIYAVGPQ
jgi:hypothetical protein